MGYSLKKHEIIRSKKDIKELFSNGSSFFIYPFKVYHQRHDRINDNQILISVPKKNFKSAVHRNLIRRRIKEAYRLNKSTLEFGKDETFSISVALIYISKLEMSYLEIENKLKDVLVRLNNIESKNT